MKKTISIILCIAMICCVSASALAAPKESIEPMNYVYWYINTNGVNLRPAPNATTSGGLVYLGDRFNNLGITDGWRHCHMTSGQNAGNKGYVADQYCTQYIGIE